MLIVALVATFLGSCKSLPEAPVGRFCGLFSPTMAECVLSNDGGDSMPLSTELMLGYQCIDPDFFAEIKVYVNSLNSYVEERCTCN